MIYQTILDSILLLFNNVELLPWQIEFLPVVATLLTLTIYFLFFLIPLLAIKMLVIEDPENKKKRRH